MLAARTSEDVERIAVEMEWMRAVVEVVDDDVEPGVRGDVRYELVGVPEGAREGEEGGELGREGGAVDEALWVVGEFGELFGPGVEEDCVICCQGEGFLGSGGGGDCCCEVKVGFGGGSLGL